MIKCWSLDDEFKIWRTYNKRYCRRGSGHFYYLPTYLFLYVVPTRKGWCRGVNKRIINHEREQELQQTLFVWDLICCGKRIASNCARFYRIAECVTARIWLDLHPDTGTPEKRWG